MSARPKYRRVIVEWLDAVVRESGWTDVEKAVADNAPHLCVSVGHLLKLDDEYVTLGLSHSDADGQDEANQTIAIPTPWVRGVWEVRKAGKLR